MTAAKLMPSADNEFVLTRTLDAPRDLVFRVWTDPKHIAQWWGPTGFTTTIDEMNVTPGGIWRLVMHGPDGRDYRNKIVYLEIVKPERLVFRHTGDADTEPATHLTTVTFAEERGKTLLTLRMEFASPAERKRLVETYNAIEGGKQTLERLAEHLGTLATGGPAGLSARELTLTRLIDAPRAVVFKTWTEPKHLAQWWGPRGFTNPVCEVDLRPGGALRIVMRAPDGAEYPMNGIFHEIAPPERLVFSNYALDAAGKTIIEGHTTVTFAEQNGKTRLIVETRAIATVPAAVAMLDGMAAGWTQSLERLEAYAPRLK